jgi:hypothetical protein
MIASAPDQGACLWKSGISFLDQGSPSPIIGDHIHSILPLDLHTSYLTFILIINLSTVYYTGHIAS